MKCVASFQNIPFTIRRRQIRVAIQHAKNICHGHEDTLECRFAWEKVRVLSNELRVDALKLRPEVRQQIILDLIEETTNQEFHTYE